MRIEKFKNTASAVMFLQLPGNYCILTIINKVGFFLLVYSFLKLGVHSQHFNNLRH